ncbi:MAG: surface-adhesin E family protein [Betaproteobacteria bacterium]
MNAAAVRGFVAAFGLGLAVHGAAAQERPPTTEQIGKDASARRQELEQQQAHDREQQQRADQQQRDQQWDDTLRQQRSRAAADAAQGRAVLRSWQQRPPLAPDHNPLLGRWQSLGAAQRPNAQGVPPEIAQLAGALIGGITGGLCDSMLGRGLVEFRPSSVVAIGRDGHERAMYRAEYRGGGSRVAVLPQGGTSFTHMIVDFNGPDHASVAGVGCVLARAGGAKKATANTAPAADTLAPLQWVKLGTSAANGGMDVYVASSAIRRSGNSAQMWDLWDFKTAHVFQGRRFLSARNHYEYDCAAARRRMLSTVGFSGHMGQGAVVGSGNSILEWESVPPGGPIRDYWKIACTKT